MRILFVLWESGSGKTTLENYLVENYWFKMFDKLTSRPPRENDRSWYMHFSAREIADMYVDGLVHECVKYDNSFYAFRVPHTTSEEDKFVCVLTPSGYHQFIDMDIEDGNEVYSIFLTNDNCDKRMRKRWDSEESIQKRIKLNKRLRRSAWEHTMINSQGWTEHIVELLKLYFPTFF